MYEETKDLTDEQKAALLEMAKNAQKNVQKIIIHCPYNDTHLIL